MATSHQRNKENLNEAGELDLIKQLFRFYTCKDEQLYTYVEQFKAHQNARGIAIVCEYIPDHSDKSSVLKISEVNHTLGSKIFLHYWFDLKSHHSYEAYTNNIVRRIVINDTLNNMELYPYLYK